MGRLKAFSTENPGQAEQQYKGAKNVPGKSWEKEPIKFIVTVVN